MKKSDTTRTFGSDPYRIGITDVVTNYGLDAVQRRIEQLRITGLHYAATAIESELAIARVSESPVLLRRQSA
ncbi:hypothetical protein [Nocardia sp. NBC_01327]|uniref:hypothetical protein n=1 Tax=Nocardia sp. NBC_01327 TaxID=2903593 RepID=UPI002E0FDACD|nr:hypothetical protein OG326_26110 [Nocardia sp. NBC_01327]